jgi:pimeloyl-ACP methyl ester carboxylesterase
MTEAAECLSTHPIDPADALRRFEAEAEFGVCDTGRYRCRYWTWGEGPPLVFIHGLSDQARAFALLGSLLAGHFRCIAYDLPSGRDDGARLRRYAHADLVEDLSAVLDRVAAQQAYVFGASFGSTIALAALRAQPERLPRAILQGGFAWRPLAPAEIWLARAACFWPGSMAHLPLRGALLRYGHYAPFADRPAEFWRFFTTSCGAAPIAAVAHRAALLHRVDLRPALGEIRQPLLLVCGERDPLVGVKCEEELLRGLPNAGLVKLAGCGHNPLYSHPENLAELVRAFLIPCGGCESVSTCPLAHEACHARTVGTNGLTL